MNKRIKGTVSRTFFAVLLLLLSACGGTGAKPTNGTTPEMTRGQFNQAVGSLGVNLSGVADALQSDAGVQAIAAFPSGGLFGGDVSPVPAPPPLPPLADPTGLVGQLETPADNTLVRGIYVYDAEAGAWALVGDSQNLVLQWDFLDSSGATSAAELTVNWGAETQEASSFDGSVEVPTEVTVTLQVDGVAAGTLDVTFAWYDAACGRILEPTSITVNGYIGSAGRLTFDNLSLGLFDRDSADTLVTSGTVSATAGEDSAELSWNISANGEVQRGEDCYAEDFEVDEATFRADVSATSANDSRSLGLGLKMNDIVSEPASARLSEGVVEVDGTTAVTFAGTLDDANGNEVPGENVTLNFVDGETVTLEAFLSGLSLVGSLLR